MMAYSHAMLCSCVGKHHQAKWPCRGNGASVLRIVPYAAIHFTAYESYRKALVRLGAEARGSRPVSPVIDLLAGSAAGATAVLITYPLDLVRTRLAFQTENGSSKPTPGAILETQQTSSTNAPSSSSSSSMRSVVSQQSRVKLLLQQKPPGSTIRGVVAAILKEEGSLGLYRGIGPTVAGILPYAGLKFYVYQSLKQYYWAHQESSPETGPVSPHKLPVTVMLTFGAGAGLVAQTLTYPLDVVRRRMQVQGVKLPPAQQQLTQQLQQQTVLRSTWHGLVTIARTQGVKSLFAGLSINYMKVVPSTAIGFTLYDSLKSYLDLANNL